MSELVSDSALVGRLPGVSARSAPRHTSLPLKLGWSVGATSLGTASYAKILILAFLVDYAGIGPALAASLIALSNLYDAVIDPAIGVASDRTKSRWGRRAPYLLAASLGMPLAWLMLFNLPAISPGLLLAYIVAALLLYSTAFGGFSVPYNAMPAEMTSSYHSRSTLMTFRTVFTMVGTTAGGYLAPTLIARMGGGRAGHSGMAMVMAAITMATGFVCVAAILRYGGPVDRPTEAARPPELTLGKRIASVWGNKPFRVLMLSHFLVMTGVAMMNSGVIFYVRRVLGAGDAWLGGFYFWMNIFIFVSLPVWLWISRRLGKRNSFIIGAIILGIVMWDWRFAQLHDPFWVYITRTFFTSFGSASVLLMSAAMLPDTMEYDRLTTGRSRAGVFSGLYTTVEKATAAIGVSSSGFILASAGYVQSNGGTIKQSKAALDAVTFIFATAPGVLIGLSAVAMLFYRLGERDLARLAQPSSDTAA